MVEAQSLLQESYWGYNATACSQASTQLGEIFSLKIKCGLSSWYHLSHLDCGNHSANLIFPYFSSPWPDLDQFLGGHHWGDRTMYLAGPKQCFNRLGQRKRSTHEQSEPKWWQPRGWGAWVVRSRTPKVYLSSGKKYKIIFHCCILLWTPHCNFK
mgnify:CR=1 FL=1